MHKTLNHEIVSILCFYTYYFTIQSIMFIISSAISPLEKKPNKSTRVRKRDFSQMMIIAYLLMSYVC